MPADTFHIAPGRLYQHRTIDYRQAIVTAVAGNEVAYDIIEDDENMGPSSCPVESFRFRYEPATITFTGLREAAKRAAAQLDPRTDQDREMDGVRVSNRVFDAVKAEDWRLGYEQVALRLGRWIAADPGRLDAFLAEHPEQETPA